MLWLALLLILTPGGAAKKTAEPASNRWRYPATCAAMEPVAFAVMKRAQFVPRGETLEEDAIVYHFSRGPFGWLDAGGVVKKYTLTRSGIFDRWYEVQVTGTDLRFLRENGGRRCVLELNITYAGFKSGVVLEGVYELPSNSVLEHELLKTMGAELAKTQSAPKP